MSAPLLPRVPVSTRLAFARALDLAVRRDALHSLAIPLLLRSPWILTLSLLPPLEEGAEAAGIVMLGSVALLGDYAVLMLTSAMLRVRARAVYEGALGAPPPPALACYAQGLRRVPWLVVTEIVRTMAIGFGLLFLIVPGVHFAYRLGLASEAVTLHEPHLAAAFGRSYRLTHRRFERWLELTVASVLPVIGVWFVLAVRSLVTSEPAPGPWLAAAWLLFALWTPVVLYAWTFFYLRLAEFDAPGVEVGPTYAQGSPDAASPGEARTEEAPEPAGMALAATAPDSGPEAGAKPVA